MAKTGLCSIPDCDKPVHLRDWCNAHYIRWRRHGTPLGGGRVRGEPRQYFTDVVLPYEGDECLIWPYACVNGYGKLQHEGRVQIISRMLCEEVNGPPPTPVHQAAHSCGKGKQGCVTKGHMVWKTRLENEADKLIHGTLRYGETQPLAKLTEADVRKIRSLAGSIPRAQIADQFGVRPEAIGKILRGERWARVS